MADKYVLSEQSARQLSDTVHELERKYKNLELTFASQGKIRTRWIVTGKITSVSGLARGGAAKFKFYTPAGVALPGTGGLAASPQSDTEYDIHDIGLMPADVSPIPQNTAIIAGWIGCWVLMEYDCDAV